MAAPKRTGFYRRLGLTRAGFYDRLGGRAGGGDRTVETQVETIPSKNVIPSRRPPKVPAAGKSRGLTRKRKRAIVITGGVQHDYTKNITEQIRKAHAAKANVASVQ